MVCTKRRMGAFWVQIIFMKVVQNLIASCLLVLLSTQVHAQFAIGLRSGLHTQTTKPEDLPLPGNNEISVKDLKFGTQFGVWARIGNRFFIQPELTFNSNSTDFQFNQPNGVMTIVKERYTNFDLPLLVGAKIGPARLFVGPVGHLFLNSQSELADLQQFDENWKALTWGWQGGLGVNLGRLGVDLRYEGGFDQYGEHLEFLNDKVNFSDNPGRIVLGVTFAIIK
jgi:Outer membrane protein beta-barrel domain